MKFQREIFYILVSLIHEQTQGENHFRNLHPHSLLWKINIHYI